jgi:uncharacterized membrane protein YuzA (DUF378 family)
MARSGVPIKLATLGLICLLISLAIPSIKLLVFQKPIDFYGFNATASAIGLMCSSPVKIKYVVLGVAGISNIIFLLTPLVLLKSANRKSLLLLNVFALIGFAFAVAAPSMVADLRPTLLAGYYVWLAGYILQILAITLKSAKSNA